MGFLNGVGKALQTIGKAAQSIMKSPFGSALVQVGLSAITRMSPALSVGIGLLNKIGGEKVLGAFQGFASKVLGPAQSFLSPPCLGGIGSFMGCAQNTSQLLSMMQSIFGSLHNAPPQEPTTYPLIQHNMTQLCAHHHARLLT